VVVGRRRHRNGLEDMTVDHTASTGITGSTTSTTPGSTTWRRSTPTATKSGQPAARIEVRDSYFHGTKRTASQSYPAARHRS